MNSTQGKTSIIIISIGFLIFENFVACAVVLLVLTDIVIGDDINL